MKFTTVIALFAFIGSSHQALFNMNKVVDKHLKKVREKAQQQGKEVITIPDISKEWEEELGFFKITCHFNCEGGWLKNMSTIRRAGDVTLRTFDDKFTLKFKMGFGEFAAHYDSCRFEANRIGRMTQKVEISTSNIVVDGQATLTHDGVNCRMDVDNVHISSMGDLKFDTGGSFFQRVQSTILGILSDHFSDEVKETLSKNLEKKLRDAVEEANVCDRLPF